MFFYSADSNANGCLTYNELERLLGGENPEQEQLELYEADNKMFSDLELIRPFEVAGKGLQSLNLSESGNR